MSLDIYLMRHGKTVYNEQGIIQGWCDSPLTEEGRAGVVKTAQRLADAGFKFDAAFCSTSPRTRITARLVLETLGQNEMPVTEIANLREYHFGSFEKQSSDELHHLLARENGFNNVVDWIEAYRTGSVNRLAQTLARIDPTRKAEDESSFLARLHHGLFEVIGLAPKKGRILVVTHGMAITGILKYIDSKSTQYQSVPNASLTRLSYSLADGLKIHSIADGGLRGSPIGSSRFALGNVRKRGLLR